MTMTHDQLHTHGPDELAMLRAECDKWHKAYDRVWEERMRFADRAIELEKENFNLKRDNEQLLLRADNWKSLCVAGEKNIAELKDKLQAAEKLTANEAWNRLCVKYNKLIELKKDFCEKFKDIELEIDK